MSVDQLESWRRQASERTATLATLVRDEDRRLAYMRVDPRVVGVLVDIAMAARDVVDFMHKNAHAPAVDNSRVWAPLYDALWSLEKPPCLYPLGDSRRCCECESCQGTPRTGGTEGSEERT